MLSGSIFVLAALTASSHRFTHCVTNSKAEKKLSLETMKECLRHLCWKAEERAFCKNWKTAVATSALSGFLSGCHDRNNDLHSCEVHVGRHIQACMGWAMQPSCAALWAPLSSDFPAVAKPRCKFQSRNRNSLLNFFATCASLFACSMACWTSELGSCWNGP